MYDEKLMEERWKNEEDDLWSIWLWEANQNSI